MLRITTEKIIVRGEKFFKVLEIEALKYDELPKEYTSESPNVYKVSNGKNDYLMKGGNTCLLSKFLQYSEKDFFAHIEFISSAVVRFREIDARLKIENKNWEGQLIVVFQ